MNGRVSECIDVKDTHGKKIWDTLHLDLYSISPFFTLFEKSEKILRFRFLLLLKEILSEWKKTA